MAVADIRFLFGQFVPRCTHDIDKHFDYAVLQYLDGGAVNLQIGTDRYSMQGRWFWSSYPGPRIRFHVAPPHKTWVHRYLAFTGPLVQQWTKDGLFPVPPQPAPLDAEYSRRFDDVLELSRRTDRWGLTRASLGVETLLTELAELRSRPTPSTTDAPPWLTTTLATMQTLGFNGDHDTLAREAGLAPRSFRRKFTALVGHSPRDYEIARRVEHAKEILGTTDLPIKTISEQLGYADVSYFTRQFRQITGIAPAKYRQSREA